MFRKLFCAASRCACRRNWLLHPAFCATKEPWAFLTEESMEGSHPYLGLIACLLYLGVAFAATSAARVADRHRDRMRWVCIATLFLALAVLRGTGLEAAATDAMRHALVEDGLYDRRRELQRPLSALAVVLVSAALYLFYLKRPSARERSRDWSRFWAMVGTTLMFGVIAMRLISFHELDRYLYGPVRLNWVLDVGSSFIVAAAALHFRKLSTTLVEDSAGRHTASVKPEDDLRL